MLKLIVRLTEGFDEVTNQFVDGDTIELQFEHSLFSLSKWESSVKKPFLGRGEKTPEETYQYIQAMCLTPEISPEVFLKLSPENIDQINEYIGDKMSATFFNDKGIRPSREIITAEIIYYWMSALGVPIECQHWHLNRLLAFIKVCNEKQRAPSKKKLTASDMAERSARNQQRKAALGTTG